MLEGIAGGFFYTLVLAGKDEIGKRMCSRGGVRIAIVSVRLLGIR